MAEISGPAGDGLTVTGTAQDDQIHVGPGNQTIDGGDGTDQIDFASVMGTSILGVVPAGVGMTVDLAAGTAVVTNWTLMPAPIYGQNNTYNYTLASIENVVGAYSPDTLKAAASGSTLAGLGGGDILIGNVGDDILIGNVGDDVLIGGTGKDTLTGGAGADIFKFSAVFLSGAPTASAVVDSYADAIDSVTDFETGVDTLDLSGVQGLGSVSIVRTGAGSAVFAQSVGQSSDLQTVIGVTGLIQGGDIAGPYASLQMVGDERDDVLIGGDHADSLYGQDGDDVLIGGGAGDALYGGTGADIFRYLDASDSTNGALDIIQDFLTGFDKIDLTALNPSNVSILYYNGGSIISGGLGASAFQIGSVRYVNAADLTGLVHGVYLVGDGDPNSLIGSVLDDSIVGGGGNDVIVGGGAGDALYGGAGADTFKYLSGSDSTSSALDIIHDFQTGIDKIDLTALNPSNVSILHSNGGTFVSGNTVGGAAFQIASTQDINIGDLIGLTGSVYMAGDAGDNVLIGGPGYDIIDGGAGNDTIIGGGTADLLYGGQGADTFKYLLSSESLAANSSDRLYDFETGVDKIDVSALNLTGVVFEREIHGAYVEGVASNGESVRISTTNPYRGINAIDIIGLNAGVAMGGSIGSDTLIGGAFNDRIDGGAGTDTIIGGGGADIMSGTGVGIVFVTPDVNTYVYQAASDSAFAAPDRIKDFQTGLDKIDLRAVHTSAGDTVNFLSDATSTYLFVQHDGQTSADMLILLDTPTFKVTDILW